MPDNQRLKRRSKQGRVVSDKTMLRRYTKWSKWKYLAYWSELWKTVADSLQPLEVVDN